MEVPWESDFLMFRGRPASPHLDSSLRTCTFMCIGGFWQNSSRGLLSLRSHLGFWGFAFHNEGGGKVIRGIFGDLFHLNSFVEVIS